MSLRSGDRLKCLVESVPPGFLVDSSWLSANGISRQLAHRYVQSGWLERVERGLYRRPSGGLFRPKQENGWLIPVLSAQLIMKHGLHVGGMTALSLAGHRHYLPLGSEPVYLFADQVPGWLRRLTTDSELRFRSVKLFDDAHLDVGTGGTPGFRTTEVNLNPYSMPLRRSSTERAVLEALNEIPKTETFHTLDMVFEGLRNLRPKHLNKLLASCTRVKVKRLFFMFADRHAHAWRKYVRPEDFDLGSGSRALTEGGRMHPDYGITVPADFVPTERPEQSGA